MDDFTMTTSSAGRGRTVVAVGGDLDLNSADRLWAAVEPLLEPEAVVVLGLASMPFVDSSGLRVLFQAARRAADVGGSLRLAAPEPAVRRVFDLTGLGEYLAVHDSVDDALAE